MMSKHSLGILKVGFHDRGHGTGDFGILDESDELIAKIVSHEDQAVLLSRAAQIVREHNAHDDLVVACRKLVEVASLVPIFQIGDGCEALEAGIAAIAKANPV
jgi:hypothetical protein